MVETFLAEKRIIKKIIIVLLFVFMFNFTFAHLGNNVVFADTPTQGENMSDEQIMNEEGGGKLLIPLHSLILFLADSVLQLMQNSFITQDPVTIKATSDEVKEASKWEIAGIVIGVVVIAVACVVTYGAAAAVIGAAAGATTFAAGVVAVTTALATYGGTIVGGLVFAGAATGVVIYCGIEFINGIEGEFQLPTIQYSPELIFSNRVPLFNINFFQPTDNVHEIIKAPPEDDGVQESNDAPVFDWNKYRIYLNEEQDCFVEIIIQNLEVSSVISGDMVGSPSITLSYQEPTGDKDMPYNTRNVTAWDSENNRNSWLISKALYDISNYYKARCVIEKGSLTEETKYLNDIRDNNPNMVIRHMLYIISSYLFAMDDVRILDGEPYGYEESLGTIEFPISEEAKERYIKLYDGLRAIEDSWDKIESGEWDKDDVINIDTIIHGINNTTKNEIVAGDVLTFEESTREVTYRSSSNVLQSTVSSTYTTLRTMAIVALLSILVYVGIRIVISSAAKDKAKYKQMLIDWLVAFILLFVLHYLMAFIIDVSEKLTQVCNKSNIENVPIYIPNGTQLKNEKGEYSGRLDKGDNSNDIWGTNFIGAVRFYAGLVSKRGFTVRGISYTLIYIVLIIYIAIFTFQYMRRVLYMAFLTMISPLVAITYPLDKINDGKAQGFNTWLREYIFNALLQPIHYIIYIIIMGGVMDLVVEAPVYALVALGFMVPAEKFIRKMFGFEKAATVSAFGGAAGAAMLMNGVQRLTGGTPSKKEKSDNKAQGTQNNPNGKIKTINSMPDSKKGGNAAKIATKGNPALAVAADAGKKTANAAGNVAKGVANQMLQSPGETRDGNPLNRIGTSNVFNPNNSMGFGNNPQTDTSYENTASDSYTTDYGIGTGNEPYQMQASYGDQTGYSTGDDSYQTYTPLQTMDTSQVDDPNFPELSQLLNGNEMPDSTIDATQYTLPQEPQTKPNISNKPRGFWGSVGEGARAVGGFYVRKLDNRLRRARPLRAMRRMLTSALGAATLGAVGLAAGIASGDVSKAFQYTSAGALAGKNLGRNLGDKVSDTLDLKDAGKAFTSGMLGNKAQQMERERYKRDFKMNNSNYLSGVSKVGADGWRKMSKKDGVIDTALDYGINNIDDMSNIYRAQQAFMQREYAARGISNPNDLSIEERDAIEKKSMQDAFEAYELNRHFGNWGKDEKVDKNLTYALENRGYEGDELTTIKEGLKDKMEVYQDSELGQTQQEDADARAAATNAQVDAYKKQKAQEAEIRKLHEEHEATQQEAEQAKRTAEKMKYQGRKTQRETMKNKYTKTQNAEGEKRTNESGDSTETSEPLPRTVTPPGGINPK